MLFDLYSKHFVSLSLASQRRCEPEERKQFPFRLMDWFVHLKQNDDFGTVDPGKTLTTITEDERRDVATVSIFVQFTSDNERYNTNN